MTRNGGPEGRSPYLPSGYLLDETDHDEVVLRRPDGSEVAAFGGTGADPKESSGRRGRTSGRGSR